MITDQDYLLFKIRLIAEASLCYLSDKFILKKGKTKKNSVNSKEIQYITGKIILPYEQRLYDYPLDFYMDKFGVPKLDEMVKHFDHYKSKKIIFLKPEPMFPYPCEILKLDNHPLFLRTYYQASFLGKEHAIIYDFNFIEIF
jgi:hypothetical protein